MLEVQNFLEIAVAYYSYSWKALEVKDFFTAKFLLFSRVAQRKLEELIILMKLSLIFLVKGHMYKLLFQQLMLTPRRK